jgi:RHS repeat-associated protein
MPLGLLAQSIDQNYILNRTYLEADGSKYNDQIQYFDGLGRSVEVVQKSITPSGKDLIDITEYDGFGRAYRQWLPASATGNTGVFVEPTTFKASLATIQYGSNEVPYTETILENSPLNRVSGKRPPGAAWIGHPTAIDYQTNSINEVGYFFVNSNAKLERNGYYAANTLYKTQVRDEDNKTTTEYKDKLGKVVMKRSSTNVDTYYVYNDLGQLSYVLPPNTVDLMSANGTFDDDGSPALTKYAYVYKYDNRGNNIIKRLPGCDYIYMVYDQTNRLTLSQDGNQRTKDKWVLTVYDILGRVIYTALTTFKGQLNALIEEYAGEVNVENYVGFDGYDDTGYPFYTAFDKILTVNYYDNYAFIDLLADENIIATLNYSENTGYGTQFPNSTGLLTGTRTYTLDETNSYTTTTLYYDDHGRVIQKRSSNDLGGYDIECNQYNFIGEVLNTKKEHSVSGQTTIAELYAYTYDNAGRLKNSTYQLNNQPAITLTSNTYDELGRLITNNRHNLTDLESYTYNIRNWTTKIKSGTFEENLFYDTNPLNSNVCYNGNISYCTWTYGTVNKGYAYTYDDLNRMTLASFKQGTSSQTDGSFNELFTFDKQGNILTLQRKKDNSLIDNLTMNYTLGGIKSNQLQSVDDAAGSQNLYDTKEYNNKSNASSNEFSYDLNGNMIKDLDRDIVAIRYNILNLPDTIQFKYGNQTVNKYDASGRKLKTEYYTLKTQLIVPLAEGTVSSLNNRWDLYNEVSGTVYLDNFEYKTSQQKDLPLSFYLDKVYNSEGYVNILPTVNHYSYYRKDHLGNNREVWSAAYSVRSSHGVNNFLANTSQVTQYYPSGLPWTSNSSDNPSLQSRKYNGKEFIEMNGYDTYDYGARGYYAAIGRFMTVDPLAEKYYSISPYAYCGGNPVNFIDPKGMDIVYFDGNAKEVGRIKSDERFESYYRVDNGTDGAVNSEISKMKGSFMKAEMPGVIAGYEASQYQQLDYQIAATTAIMNDKLKSLTGLPSTDNHQFTENSQTPKLDVNLVKSMIMEESKMGTAKGGMGTAKTDPMQVNNNGDWSKDKTSVGLTKGQSMNAEISINAGVRMLVLKGMKSDASGNYTTWRGDRNAVQKYNGGGNPSYVNDVFKYFNSVQPATRSNYVTK